MLDRQEQLASHSSYWVKSGVSFSHSNDVTSPGAAVIDG
jgi:hypothetical protein